MSARVSWHAARVIAGAAASALVPELVDLGECSGRVLVGELLSPIDIPHFASSAMDGWIVVGDGPWELTAAGPGDGQARVIVTGALVPPGATAVLRGESGVVTNGLLNSSVPAEPRPGQHIRLAGTEAASGERLIGAGTLLNPAHVALAASAGIDALSVRPVPTIALVFTGDEVVTSGTPAAGQVRDSFGVQLPTLFGQLGGRVTSTNRVEDDLEHTVAAIRDTVEQLVVTTGGTGDSAVDHVREALRILGAHYLLDGVAMRPGGPTTIAMLPDGRLVASLPGNPLAAMVAAITLCEPIVAALAGRPARATRTTTAPAAGGREGSTLLLPYRRTAGRAGVVPWTGSGMMRGLADADGLLVVPGSGLAEGDSAESVDLPWRV